MKIKILSVGSRGDTQPFIALSKGLAREGFKVTMVVSKSVAQLVEQASIDVISLRVDVKAVLKNRSKAMKEKEAFSQRLKNRRKLVREMIPPLIDESVEACHGADLLLFGGICFIYSAQVLEALKIPGLHLFLQPITPTAKVAPLLSPVHSLGGWLNLFAAKWMLKMMWKIYQEGIDFWRQKQGFKELGADNPFLHMVSRESPILYGYSPNVFPPPADWSPLHYPSGYWFLDNKDDYQPPEDLLGFLESGPTPVCVGFGSMGSILDVETIEIVTQAVAMSGCRAVFLTGWGQKPEKELSPNIYCMEEAPHDWLFPKMAALVHHGGAGTTAAGLRAGKAAQIVAHISDQMFWSFRLCEMGAGLPFIHRKKLTAKKLARSIGILLSNKKLVQNAEEIGEKIRREKGVEKAVEFIKARALKF